MIDVVFKRFLTSDLGRKQVYGLLVLEAREAAGKLSYASPYSELLFKVQAFLEKKK